MNKVSYQVSSAKLSGHLIITYFNGHLKRIESELKEPLTEQQWYWISSVITPEHKDFRIAALEKLNLKVKVLMAKTSEPSEMIPTNEKISQFCAAFEKKFSIKYKATKTDGGKFKALPLGRDEFEALLNLYMQSDEWYLKPKSIANFIGKINELRLLFKAPAAASKFPIPYDREYDQRLTQDKRNEYYAALRAAGYVYRNNPGRLGKWLKKE
ncbi:MAG: hypothetical protein IE931_05650 [Sphingobacteriales bacterium]|nr:hypothetical protein [Sphingobacteriales bacterium]